MNEDNLSQSERMIASVVGHLAKNGVRPIEFTATDLGYEASSENDDLFIDSILWLMNERVLHSNATHQFYGNSDSQTVAEGFTLTSNGFALLAQRFEGKLTLGDAIKATTTSGRGYSNVGDLVGGILGGFTKSIAN